VETGSGASPWAVARAAMLKDLFWDVDGSDPGLLPVKVAHFTSPVALTPDDFDIVA
jgi:hypothetical protein